MMSEKCKQHVDSCRFCWMCHHICPIGNATGQERNSARARALGISLVNRGAVELSDIMDNIYECSTCGACVHDCATGWDPVMFTKEARLQAALEGKLPAYIERLVSNCLNTGNAYGKASVCEALTEAIRRHSSKTDTLLFLGTDARFMACGQALKAVKVLEKAGISFSLLENEAPSGAQLDFLIGAAHETREQMEKCAAVLGEYRTVVVYDPNDARAIRQQYREYGIDVSCDAVTFTAFLAKLLDDGRITAAQTGKPVVFQDPYQLSRDLGETEEARRIVSAYAVLHEMLLCREETVWAGNILMAEYMPEVIRLVARRRILNAQSIGARTIVTACVSEYASLKAVAEDMEILSVEDLIPDKE